MLSLIYLPHARYSSTRMGLRVGTAALPLVVPLLFANVAMDAFNLGPICLAIF